MGGGGAGGCALSSAVQETDNVQVLSAEVRSCQFTDVVWLTVRLALLNTGRWGICISNRAAADAVVQLQEGDKQSEVETDSR